MPVPDLYENPLSVLKKRRHQMRLLYLGFYCVCFALLASLLFLNVDYALWVVPVILFLMMSFYPLTIFLFRLEYKKYLIDFLCKATGFSFSPSGYFGDKTLVAHSIPIHPIAWSYRHKHEDAFKGSVAGVPCVIQEVVYAGDKYAKRAVNNFPRDMFPWRWIFVSLKVGRRHDAHTIIVPEESSAKTMAKTLRGLNRVHIVSGDFENHYEVFSSDQVESRAYLTPDRIEAFTALARGRNMRDVQISFRGDDVLICFRSSSPLLAVPRFSFLSKDRQDRDYLKNCLEVFFSDLQAIEHMLQQMGIADTKSTAF